MADTLEKLSAVINARAKNAVNALADEVAAGTEEYVPFRTGRLMNSVRTENKSSSRAEVKYTVWYANECYYATHPFSKKRHPKATARWFEAAKSAKLDLWKKLVSDILTARGGKTDA